MNLVLSLEARFQRTPDGAVWDAGVYGYNFWERYLEVFDSVAIVVRVRDVEAIPERCVRADGGGVRFIAVPYYVGPWQFVCVSKKVLRITRAALDGEDAVIMRVPSTIAACMVPHLKKNRQPYGVEVVGDPYDMFAPGPLAHPLRPVFRQMFSWELRRTCGLACGAAYVTRYALQRRYPCHGYSSGVSDVALPAKAYVTGHSSKQLDDSTFVSSARSNRTDGSASLIFVGSLEQLYKGPDVLIDAVAEVVGAGVDVRVTWIGDGKHRRTLEERCERLGMANRMRFCGHLPAGDAVREELDKAHVFVLPSRQEGLPRAMIEAMARGLPCIGSSVGGIPELLQPEDLVPPGDVRALAEKIREVVTDADRMWRMSLRNLATAADYREEVLRERRLGFYRYIKEQTELWMKLRDRR